VYVWRNPPANLAISHGALSACPTTFDDWNGTELTFEDAVVDELQADDILVRRYQRGDERVWLCIVYHQNRRYGAHDPRVCYESQGYIVGPQTHARIADGSALGLEVNRFTVERPRDSRVIYYWWTTRGVSTADADAWRTRMALGGALDNRSWGAFVRVEALVQNGDPARAERSVADFASRVAKALPAVFAGAEARGKRPS
jgi:EpsI family protein